MIPDEDMIKLGDFFEQNFDGTTEISPRKLQQAVMFMIMYFTCHRGRENLYEMTPEMYKVYTDPTGRKYVAQAIDEMDKNYKEDSTDVANAAKMYETPGK